MLIGKILKENRRHNALSQEQVAIKLHVSHQTVSSWEQDRTKPDKESLKKNCTDIPSTQVC
ncbi:helix-turn-helix transcriptional regulator [Oenococcus sicerae]|uniref:Helix-turn-helix transcriptional regulator n=2 Tax=Oenococcus sicerae TaxID=2203724 RepID=A0ABX5QML5_9LACO|nr:helix-turn-helix transcriptional regulator [Oenococcus sicerae]